VASVYELKDTHGTWYNTISIRAGGSSEDATCEKARRVQNFTPFEASSDPQAIRRSLRKVTKQFPELKFDQQSRHKREINVLGQKLESPKTAPRD